MRPRSELANAPLVTVVIPCYDLGAFLEEAVDSVLAQTLTQVEVMVVDDGSTDPATRALLDGFERPRTRTLRSRHRGVSGARNAAIREARGRFILPLDADDRIAPSYLEKAVLVLEKEPDVGIVECEAELFGERQGRWERPRFAMPDFLLGNTLAPASLFRVEDFHRTRGYNDNMVHGWEDFDFWLSIVALGRRVVRIPETLLFYRVRHDSRSSGMTRRRRGAAYARILANHPGLFARHPTILPRYAWRMLQP
jgi:glycosyltransferase involved in cell wall biosynthesis